MIRPAKLHHAPLRVSDGERAKRFCESLLGLAAIVRPGLAFPGPGSILGSEQLRLIHGPQAAETRLADAARAMGVRRAVADPQPRLGRPRVDDNGRTQLRRAARDGGAEPLLPARAARSGRGTTPRRTVGAGGRRIRALLGASLELHDAPRPPSAKSSRRVRRAAP